MIGSERPKETPRSARAYDWVHVPRPYTPGRRRVSAYITWSYPGEVNRDVAVLDNRFSTWTEVRRVAWPMFETPQYADPNLFQQGITGSLELFFLAWEEFQQLVAEITGHPMPFYQRVDQAGHHLPLDERVLADTDTLLLWGLDSISTDQEPAEEEIEAVREFLTREGSCLVLGPHHDVGASDDMKVRDMEYYHHGDPLVPRQQRFAKYVRSLMEGLGVPVENRYGLRSKVVQENPQVTAITAHTDLDTRGWLSGVTTLNVHQHLPHYALTVEESPSIRVLASQEIDLWRPHPFTEAGNREYNRFVWMPPDGTRAGDILLLDSTVFSTLFGGDESLRRFWRNLVER
jgi:hypothetical protein